MSDDDASGNGMPDTAQPGNGAPDGSAPDNEVPDTDIPDDGTSENGTLPMEGSTLSSGAVATLSVTSGIEAGGLPGSTLEEVRSLRLNRGGTVAFRSRVTPEGGSSASAPEHVLAGPATDPRIVLTQETSIEGIRDGFRFETAEGLDVAADGTLLVTARIRDDGIPGDFLSGSSTRALIRVDGDGAENLITASDSITTLGGEAELQGIEEISISDAGIAFIGQLRGVRANAALFVLDDTGPRAVVEHVNGNASDAPKIDGCDVVLPQRGLQRLEMLDSGALVFNVTLDRENINAPCERDMSAVLRHENSTLSVIAREGDPVPGAPTFRFGPVTIHSILADGDVVVASTLIDDTRGFAQRDIVSRLSFWLFPTDGGPRLIWMEGETLERGDGSLTLDLGNLDTDSRTSLNLALDVSESGHSALRIVEDDFRFSRTRVSLHGALTGQGQPHVSLDAPGASNYAYLDEIHLDSNIDGSSLEPVLPGTDRLQRIGDAAVDTRGNVYFHARVRDPGSGAPKGDYIFRRDLQGVLSIVVSPLDRVDVEGTERLILSDVIGGGFGLSAESVEVDLVTMRDDSLAIINDGTIVLVSFPDNQ